MKKYVELYDPHPGIGGASASLPMIMKEAAEKLNGKKMDLEEVIRELDSRAQQIGGYVKVIEEKNGAGWISFRREEGNPYPIHSYRLIRYRPIGNYGAKQT